MKTFTQTDMAAMTEAAKFLGLGPVTVEEDPGDGPTEITIDGFTVSIEEGEVEQVSLNGNRMVPCVTYIVYAEYIIHGGRWEPDVPDYKEVARENSPLNALGVISNYIHQQKINDVLEGAYWNHYHKEAETYYEEC
jgi:hypothetical protein